MEKEILKIIAETYQEYCEETFTDDQNLKNFMKFLRKKAYD